jgi:hypothetical protein
VWVKIWILRTDQTRGEACSVGSKPLVTGRLTRSTGHIAAPYKTCRPIGSTSAVPTITDIHRSDRHVCFVPLTDSCAAANGIISNRQYLTAPRSELALQVPQPKSDPSTAILQSYLKNRELQFKHRTSASNRLYCARCRTAARAGVPVWSQGGTRIGRLLASASRC